MNDLQRKLVEAGLAKAPRTRKRGRRKNMTCRRCGEVMERKDATNVVVCPNCGNYVIFDKE